MGRKPGRRSNDDIRAQGNGTVPEENMRRWKESMECYGQRVAHMISHGNFEGARAIVDAAEKDRTLQKLEPVLELPLAEVNIPTRICNMLECFGVLVVGDMAQHRTESLLANVENFGMKSLDVVWHSILLELARRDVRREELETQLASLKMIGSKDAHDRDGPTAGNLSASDTGNGIRSVEEDFEGFHNRP